MSRVDGPAGTDSSLLADLQVDRHDRLATSAHGTTRPAAAIRPTPAAVTPAAVTPAAVTPAATTPAAGRAPAFELRVTPLHWSLPRIGRLPTGVGVAVCGGPVRLALTLLG